MGFNCGIVGLPNVGKSTLFNALTETASAAAANYPFCTIEPNVGRVPVPDPRLDLLAELGKSAKIIATQLEIKDIAGLVRGASRGEGPRSEFAGSCGGRNFVPDGGGVGGANEVSGLGELEFGETVVKRSGDDFRPC